MYPLNTDISVQRLPKNQHALLRKFYRSHKSPMAITQHAEVWVVRAPAIIAGACLSPVSDGYWLTSLYTAPHYRQQGMASLLIQHLQTIHQGSPIWLFCHPELQQFYHSLDFRETLQLPAPLKQRLARYQQSKALIAMLYTKYNITPQ